MFSFLNKTFFFFIIVIRSFFFWSPLAPCRQVLSCFVFNISITISIHETFISLSPHKLYTQIVGGGGDVSFILMNIPRFFSVQGNMFFHRVRIKKCETWRKFMILKMLLTSHIQWHLKMFSMTCYSLSLTFCSRVMLQNIFIINLEAKNKIPHRHSKVVIKCAYDAF